MRFESDGALVVFFQSFMKVSPSDLEPTFSGPCRRVVLPYTERHVGQFHLMSLPQPFFCLPGEPNVTAEVRTALSVNVQERQKLPVCLATSPRGEARNVKVDSCRLRPFVP
jgi:hypothetical protein